MRRIEHNMPGETSPVAIFIMEEKGDAGLLKKSLAFHCGLFTVSHCEVAEGDETILVPLLCKEGLGEVESPELCLGSTPPNLPLQRGGSIGDCFAALAMTHLMVFQQLHATLLFNDLRLCSAFMRVCLFPATQGGAHLLSRYLFLRHVLRR